MSARPEHPDDNQINEWLRQAREGSRNALGHALDACRQYLLMVANEHLPRELRAKAGPSDLVNVTIVEAVKNFDHFQGGTAEQLLAWLTTILNRRIANFIRDFSESEKRRVDREVPLAQVHDNFVSDDGETPSKEAVRREDAEGLEVAVNRLSPDHRQVMLLHYKEHLSFEEIAPQMNRSIDAVRQLWKRAFAELKRLLRNDHG